MLRPCPPFEKARERMLQIAMRGIPAEYNERAGMERAVRSAIEEAFRGEARVLFTYEKVVKTKHVFGFIDRKLDENGTAACMAAALEIHRRVTGTDLYRLPRVKECARNAVLRLILREPLGSVAIARLFICRRTLALTREQLLLL
jgi:hypothetical protein